MMVLGRNKQELEARRAATETQIALLSRALSEAKALPEQDVFVLAHIAALQRDLGRMAKEHHEIASALALYPFTNDDSAPKASKKKIRRNSGYFKQKVKFWNSRERRLARIRAKLEGLKTDANNDPPRLVNRAAMSTIGRLRLRTYDAKNDRRAEAGKAGEEGGGGVIVTRGILLTD
jgi:hypothetical protein